MFIRVIFERLAGKGRTKYRKIITHLDLSGTKSFHGKSGSVLLFSSGTLVHRMRAYLGTTFVLVGVRLILTYIITF